MTPKVSIIVPIYKVEKFIKRCIDSLLNQTLRDIEIILIDDESPDNCPQICDEYAQCDNRIKVIHKTNAGLGMACNSGIEVAIGDYIAFCDSDDYVDGIMYETMYKTAIEEQADIVFTGIQTVDQEGVITPMSQPAEKKSIHDTKQIRQYLLNMIASEPSANKDREIPMSAKIALYKREIIVKHNLQFESERIFISEDLIWHIDILCNAKCICLLPRTFYYYYNNTNSLSKKIRTDRFPFFLKIREEIIQRTKKYGLIDEVNIRVDRMFIGYVRFYIRQICCSSLTYAKKKKIIMLICKNNIWEDIWNNYPIYQMPKSHCFILYLIKYKAVFFMNLIFKIKNI